MVSCRSGCVCAWILYLFAALGTENMANFSPISRAEISARLPEQLFLKRCLRLNGEVFCTGRNFQPRLKGWKPRAFAAKFQPGLRRELWQAQWWNIRRNKMAAMEMLCWNPGWKSPCNCKKKKKKKFSPGGRLEFQPRLKFVMQSAP